MASKSSEQIQADNHFPTIHFNSCSNTHIYVNTIINTPHPDCQPNWNTIANVSPKNPGDKNRKPEEHFIKPHEGGSVIIYYGSKEGKGSSSLPSITVEIPQLTPKENDESKSMPYVITVSGKEALIASSGTQALSAAIADRDKIQAENVILNSAGPMNIGPGGGAINLGTGAGSVNLLCKCCEGCRGCGTIKA